MAAQLHREVVDTRLASGVCESVPAVSGVVDAVARAQLVRHAVEREAQDAALHHEAVAGDQCCGTLLRFTNHRRVIEFRIPMGFIAGSAQPSRHSAESGITHEPSRELSCFSGAQPKMRVDLCESQCEWNSFSCRSGPGIRNQPSGFGR